MALRTVDIFFSGLFMDIDLLQQRGLHPRHPQMACLDGFDIVIGDRATLIPRAEARVYGIVTGLTFADIDTLYAEPSVQDYRPEAVLALAGISTEALCTYGQMLWTVIHPWTGIPVSMNIGSTKTLANPANRLAKLSLEAHAVGALLASPEVEATLAEPLHEVHHGTSALVYNARPTGCIRVYLVYSTDAPTEVGRDEDEARSLSEKASV